MWQTTRLMGEAIAEGIREVSPTTTVKLMNAGKEDKNDILTEVFRSRALLLGSPTINNGYGYGVAGLLEMIRGLKFKKKHAAAFGSYGWSGEAVKQLSERLEQAGFAMLNEGLRMAWVPDDASLQQCRGYGRNIAQALNA